MVQRTVNAEAKTSLRSSTMVWDLDIYCPKGHHLSYNTFSKMQTQGSKDFSRPKKPKPKDPKSAPLRDNMAKSSKKDDRKDKNKRFQDQKWKHTEERKEQTLPTSINNTYVSKKKKKKRDISKITYFNYNKISHFASNYTELKN